MDNLPFKAQNRNTCEINDLRTQFRASPEFSVSYALPGEGGRHLVSKRDLQVLSHFGSPFACARLALLGRFAAFNPCERERSGE